MNFLVTDEELVSVADKIREKTGIQNSIAFPDGFVGAISSINSNHPQLYPAIVNGGYNEVSWENNPNNGAFGRVVARIDDSVVSSPLVITQEMDGKDLIIDAIDENFDPNSTTINLAYLQEGTSVIAIGENAARASGDKNGFYVTADWFIQNDGVSQGQAVFSWNGIPGTATYTNNLQITSNPPGSTTFHINTSLDAPRSIATGLADKGAAMNVSGTLTVMNITNGDHKTATLANQSEVTLNFTGWSRYDRITIIANFS